MTVPRKVEKKVAMTAEPLVVKKESSMVANSGRLTAAKLVPK